MKALSTHGEIYLASITEDDTPKEHVSPLLPYLTQCHLFRITHRQRITSLVKSTWRGTPLQTGWFYSPTIHDQLQALILTIQPDIIIVQLARMAAYTLDYPCIKILDYMDAFGVGMLRRAAISSGLTKLFYRLEGKRMLKYETKIAAAFDHRWIISAQDREQINLPPTTPITVMPNGIDQSFLNYLGNKTKEYDLIFVGNMSYLPNIEAAQYIVQKICPLLPNSIKVEIAGTSPDRRIKALASRQVTVSGYVEDIRVAYARGKVFCAPLWSGTGQQNKILEAMAMGIPCITTTSVNQAIGGQHMHEIIIADDAQSFAEAISLLLQNEELYQMVSQKGRQYVAQNYQWEAQIAQVLSHYDK
jgi:polysaccharide biosynthesis protein PslH